MEEVREEMVVACSDSAERSGGVDGSGIGDERCAAEMDTLGDNGGDTSDDWMERREAVEVDINDTVGVLLSM